MGCEIDAVVQGRRIGFSKQKLVNILFIVIVFVVTRQVPFSFLSPIMNLSVISILLLSIYNKRLDKYSYLLIFSLLLLPLCCSLFYSIVITDNNIVLALKFFLVLFSVGMAYFVHVGERALKWFVGLCALQAIILMLIYFYLILFLDIKTYLPLRFFFLEKGWGDVYTYNGFFYRVQIKGSALLLIAFVLNLEVKLFKYQYFVAFLLLAGVILAGNFAFLISLFLYFLYKVFSVEKIKVADVYFFKVLCIVFLAILIMPFVIEYAKSVIEMKKDTSLSTRGDQLEQLMKNLSETPFTLMLGQGLGNTLDVKTAFRDYTDDTYFEIQILYVINQLGIIFSLLFATYNLLISLKNWGRSNFKLYFIYFIYVSYAITNPYILDTNHVVLIIVLNSMQLIINKSNEHQKSSGSNRAVPS